MSRSSKDGSSTKRGYKDSWKALFRLIRSGNSFSGHERHCAFLNLGEKDGFATVSSISGFDLPEDGRALAVVDWNQDGRLDLWTSNRTSPRVRYFENQLDTGNAYVALRLQGRTTNRDGVGARVDLLTSDGPRIRILAAGSGFLSQSSKWLHFGLGKSQIEGVFVRWPGGSTEHFTGVTPNARYLLVEGEGTATPVPPREPTTLAPSRLAMLAETDEARTILAARLPLPRMPYRTADSSRTNVQALAGKPLLVSFWASWCGNCTREFEELTAHADEIRAADLGVLALNVDDIDLRIIASRRLSKIGWPYASGFAVAETLDLLEAVRMSVLQNYGEIALPTSLLLDEESRLIAIYHGPVQVERLLADLELPDDPEGTRDGATSFGGRWTQPPPPPASLSLAAFLTELGYEERAREYLSDLEPDTDPPPEESTSAPKASKHPLR